MSDFLSDEDLDRLETLLASAAIGPCEIEKDEDAPEMAKRIFTPAAGRTLARAMWTYEAELFAAARNALPQLLAEVRRCRATRNRRA